MQGALQQTANISRLYFRRKEERRMLISVEGTVRLKKRNLGSYLSQSKLDKLLKAAWRKRNHVQLQQSGDYKGRTQVKTGQRKSSMGNAYDRQMMWPVNAVAG